MTRKSNKASEVAWRGYVAIDVTDDMLDKLSPEGTWSYSEMDDVLDVWTSLGYMYSTKFNDMFDSYEAAMYGADQVCVNAGIKVSAKAPTLAEANQLLVMKLELLGSESWEAFLGTSELKKYR